MQSTVAGSCTDIIFVRRANKFFTTVNMLLEARHDALGAESPKYRSARVTIATVPTDSEFC